MTTADVSVVKMEDEAAECAEERADEGTSKAATTAEVEWDANSEQYRANACCELVHYRTAAYAVAGFELLGAGGLFGLLLLIQAGPLPIVVYCIVLLLCVVTLSLLAAGVALERPLLLWPHMCLQIAVILAGLGLTLLAVSTMAAGMSWAEKVFGLMFGLESVVHFEATLGPIWPFCLAVIFDFGAAAVVWTYVLVRGCYDFLLDKQFFQTYNQHQKADKQTAKVGGKVVEPTNDDDVAETRY